MTRIGASQLAPHNINVNTICPDATRSEMYDTIIRQIVERDKITEAEAISRIDASIPLRRSNTREVSPTSRLFWRRKNHGISPANR